MNRLCKIGKERVSGEAAVGSTVSPLWVRCTENMYMSYLHGSAYCCEQ